MDAVIIQPLGAEEVLPGIRACKEAGKIVVISNNEAGYCPEADLSVRFNSILECGKGAEKIVELLEIKNGEPKGVVLLGLGDVRNSEHIERADAIRNVFKNYPGIEIHEYISGMDAGTAVTEVGTLLRTLPQVDAVYSIGMLEFMGNINALKRENMDFPIGNPDHIICVGMDSCPDVINPAVREGLVDMVIDQPVLAYNAIAAYYLLQLLDADGDTSVLPAPGTLVTADDIDVTSMVPQKDLDFRVPANSWAPLTIVDTTEEFGHLWFQTNGRTITKDNVDDPSLWSNITGQIRNFGW
jgi:ABC-type sugar transport system substrate-binding protein